MSIGVPVYVATTWKDRGRRDHFRLYGLATTSQKDRIERMVFDGMDGITIDHEPSTPVKGSWTDLRNHPERIEELIGPKGLGFLKCIDRQQNLTGIAELHVVSAWQFSVLSIYDDGVVDLVLSALRDHLSLVPLRFEWVLS